MSADAPAIVPPPVPTADELVPEQPRNVGEAWQAKVAAAKRAALIGAGPVTREHALVLARELDRLQREHENVQGDLQLVAAENGAMRDELDRAGSEIRQAWAQKDALTAELDTLRGGR